MSAPHVTGLAALYMAAHPEFTPMMVKSALMTTARDVVGSDGKAVRQVLSAGAGFVDPTKMLSPGLVYDSTPVDWLSWLEVRASTPGPVSPPSTPATSTRRPSP